MKEQSMTKTKISKPKVFLFYLIGFAFTFGLIFVLGETIVRISTSEIKEKEKPPPYNVGDLDEKYGWRMKANYFWEGEMKTEKKVPYPVRLTSTKYGFKEFGDVDSEKPKVFFVGDSFTQSVQVSNEKTFYRILQDSLDFELFAYGQSGWGNLQELFLIEEYLEEIKPDLIVLEVCANDFIDNHHGLETVCGYKVKQRRPYLGLDGDIQYLRSDRLAGGWLNHSEFWKLLEEKWSNIQYNYFEQSKKNGEYYISRQGLDYQLYKESFDITFKIFERLQKRLTEFDQSTKLLVFPASAYEPPKTHFKMICDSLNIQYSEAPANELYEHRKKRTSIFTADWVHWNEKGQEVVAKALMPVIGEFVKD